MSLIIWLVFLSYWFESTCQFGDILKLSISLYIHENTVSLDSLLNPIVLRTTFRCFKKYKDSFKTHSKTHQLTLWLSKFSNELYIDFQVVAKLKEIDMQMCFTYQATTDRSVEKLLFSFSFCDGDLEFLSVLDQVWVSRLLQLLEMMWCVCVSFLYFANVSSLTNFAPGILCRI